MKSRLVTPRARRTTLITGAIRHREKFDFPFVQRARSTMSAVRLARGVTKRDFILKFEGCYTDTATVSSPKPAPASPRSASRMSRRPAALAALTLNAPYNDLSAVEKIFEQHKQNRRNHRRAHRRQHGSRPAAPNFLPACAKSPKRTAPC